MWQKERERGEILLSIIHRVPQLPRNTQIDTFYRVIAKSFYIIALHAWGHIWLFRHHHHTLETHKDMKSCLCLSATYNLCIGMNVVVGSSSRAEQTDKGLITCPQWQLLACQRRNLHQTHESCFCVFSGCVLARNNNCITTVFFVSISNLQVSGHRCSMECHFFSLSDNWKVIHKHTEYY